MPSNGILSYLYNYLYLWHSSKGKTGRYMQWGSCSGELYCRTLRCLSNNVRSPPNTVFKLVLFPAPFSASFSWILTWSAGILLTRNPVSPVAEQVELEVLTAWAKEEGLTLLCVSQTFSQTFSFSASSLIPALQDRWHPRANLSQEIVLCLAGVSPSVGSGG